MNVLHLSKWGEAVDLAFRMQTNGVKVKVWIEDARYRKEILTGLLDDKVQSWQPWVQWADYILFDTSGMSSIWNQVYRHKPCFGGSEFADTLEKDREFAHDVMRAIGLKRLESETYKTVKDAVVHLKTHKTRHVVKPFGDKVDSHHIIIGEYENNEDAIALLARFEESKLPFEGIEVEERKLGIEVGVSGWFNGRDWVKNNTGIANINFEQKHSATGGLGHLTGEMGTSLTYDPDTENKIFRNTLDKLRPLLVQADYRGQIDISLIVDDEGNAWPLEFTSRLGYPACLIESALQITPFEELFKAIANGRSIVNEVKPSWACGVVVVTPGFPSQDEVKKKSAETPIFLPQDERMQSCHLYEAKIGKTGLVTTKEGIGYPVVVTGTGATIAEAKSSTYALLDPKKQDRVYIPNAWYRTDIGDRVLRNEGKLSDLGILSCLKKSSSIAPGVFSTTRS